MENLITESLTLRRWICEIETRPILANDPQVSHFVPITFRLELPTTTPRPMTSSGFAKPGTNALNSQGN
jgi:hypothetical protein